MSEFEKMLNEYGNDNPENFPSRWEAEYWGDKIDQSRESKCEDACEEHEIRDASHKSDLGKRDMRRRKASRHKKYMRNLASFGTWPGGATIKEKDNGKEYVVALHRGRRSRYLKKLCNRHFRRSSKLGLLVMSEKGAYRKLTEFWWEYG